jgi:hypothetical protein
VPSPARGPAAGSNRTCGISRTTCNDCTQHGRPFIHEPVERVARGAGDRCRERQLLPVALRARSAGPRRQVPQNRSRGETSRRAPAFAPRVFLAQGGGARKTLGENQPARLRRTATENDGRGIHGRHGLGSVCRHAEAWRPVCSVALHRGAGRFSGRDDPSKNASRELRAAAVRTSRGRRAESHACSAATSTCRNSYCSDPCWDPRGSRGSTR